MFAPKQFARFFSATPSIWGASKSHLAKLRKKTGYTFSNCKKALDMHNNDLEQVRNLFDLVGLKNIFLIIDLLTYTFIAIHQAEKWLHDQAQALGWSKATNLGGRKASEGLVAVVINKNHGAMVELNCETDFVSRNSSFHSLIKMVAKSCLSLVPQMCSTSNPLSKVSMKLRVFYFSKKFIFTSCYGLSLQQYYLPYFPCFSSRSSWMVRN